jgi:hypothetical protein
VKVVDELRRTRLEFPERCTECVGGRSHQPSRANPTTPVGNIDPDVGGVVSHSFDSSSTSVALASSSLMPHSIVRPLLVEQVDGAARSGMALGLWPISPASTSDEMAGLGVVLLVE